MRRLLNWVNYKKKGTHYKSGNLVCRTAVVSEGKQHWTENLLSALMLMFSLKIIALLKEEKTSGRHLKRN